MADAGLGSGRARFLLGGVITLVVVAVAAWLHRGGFEPPRSESAVHADAGGRAIDVPGPPETTREVRRFDDELWILTPVLLKGGAVMDLPDVPARFALQTGRNVRVVRDVKMSPIPISEVLWIASGSDLVALVRPFDARIGFGESKSSDVVVGAGEIACYAAVAGAFATCDRVTYTRCTRLRASSPAAVNAVEMARRLSL